MKDCMPSEARARGSLAPIVIAQRFLHRKYGGTQHSNEVSDSDKPAQPIKNLYQTNRSPSS